MHISLNVKFAIAYVIFAMCSFLCISTYTSRMMLDNATETNASAFYQEGLYMADQYVGNYFEEPENRKTLSTIHSQMESLDVYLNAEIWLISREGTLILESDSPVQTENRPVIKGFHSVLPGGKYYTTGDFFGCFHKEMLSVLVPVTHNYHVRGYIAIHTPMSSIIHEKEGYLLPFYITLLPDMVDGVMVMNSTRSQIPST